MPKDNNVRIDHGDPQCGAVHDGGHSLECLSPASFWKPAHLPLSAWFEHAPFAFWLTEMARPEVFVELGTHHGFSYLSFCQAVQRLQLSTACYAIDTWRGDEHSGFYDDEVFHTLHELNQRHYSGFSELIRSTFDKAVPYFADGSVDLLHIDGRHRYEDVAHDFASWMPKLSNRAIVLLHDINVREREFGVWQFWHELKTRYPSFEFFHGHGLGIVNVGTFLVEGLRPLFKSDEAAQSVIRHAYAHLGHSVQIQYDCDQFGLEI